MTGCPRCGAPATDPRPGADGRTTYAIVHLGYCPIGRVIARAPSPLDVTDYLDNAPRPYEPGDYLQGTA